MSIPLLGKQQKQLPLEVRVEESMVDIEGSANHFVNLRVFSIRHTKSGKPSSTYKNSIAVPQSPVLLCQRIIRVGFQYLIVLKIFVSINVI